MNSFKTQKEMYDWIWDNRPHESALSGKTLLPKGHFQFYWQFLHVLPKGSYPSYKLKSDNILLALPDEHARQNDYPVFNRKYEELRRQYYMEIYSKKF